MIGYVARKKFGPNNGSKWEKYISFAGLTHLKEVVSLDVALCPTLMKPMDEDDVNSVKVYFGYTTAFQDLDWVIQKTKGIENKQILAVLIGPDENFKNAFSDPRFKFFGFDLIDDTSGISALLNCGGFEGVFVPRDLTEYGLIDDYQKARKIQRLLMEKYPDDDHAYCDLWAIWRLKED